MRIAVLVFLCASLAAGAAGAVQHDGAVPPSCDAASVLAEVGESLLTSPAMLGAGPVTVKRVAPILQAGLEANGPVQRRYCRAQVRLSSGDWPRVLYVIEQRASANEPRISICVPRAAADGACAAAIPLR